MFDGTLKIEGDTLSIRFIVCVQDAVRLLFPASVAVNVLNTCCCPAQGPVEVVTSLNVIDGVPEVQPELAVAVAIPAIAVEGTTEVGQAVKVVGHEIIGLEHGEVQFTVTWNAAVVWLPQLSTAV